MTVAARCWHCGHGGAGATVHTPAGDVCLRCCRLDMRCAGCATRDAGLSRDSDGRYRCAMCIKERRVAAEREERRR
jgi:hypothetical protein